MPARYLLGHGALLELASQDEDTPLFRWASGIGADEIQTSVLAIAIAKAMADHSRRGKDRELWLEALDQLERDITVHAGVPLTVGPAVAREWVGLRFADLKSQGPGGEVKSTSQDVRLVIATALAHGLILVDDVVEPYHTQVKRWGCKVLVPG